MQITLLKLFFLNKAGPVLSAALKQLGFPMTTTVSNIDVFWGLTVQKYCFYRIYAIADIKKMMKIMMR